LQTCNVGVVSRRRRGEGGLLMFGCCTHHGSQHGRNIVATCGGGEKKDAWCLDVARNLVRNMFATHSQHRSLNVARITVRNMGKALRNIAKVVRNICSPRNAIEGWSDPNRAAHDPKTSLTGQWVIKILLVPTPTAKGCDQEFRDTYGLAINHDEAFWSSTSTVSRALIILYCSSSSSASAGPHPVRAYVADSHADKASAIDIIRVWPYEPM
jgi:hypothetical protein